RRGRVRRPAGDRRRGAQAAAAARRGGHHHRGARGGARRRPHRCAPLHLRPAGSGPGHPNLGRTAPVRFPALAVRALRVLVLRGVLAGVPARRLPAGPARLRRPAPPLRFLARASHGPGACENGAGPEGPAPLWHARSDDQSSISALSPDLAAAVQESSMLLSPSSSASTSAPPRMPRPSAPVRSASTEVSFSGTWTPRTFTGTWLSQTLTGTAMLLPATLIRPSFEPSMLLTSSTLVLLPWWCPLWWSSLSPAKASGLTASRPAAAVATTIPAFFSTVHLLLSVRSRP